MSAEIINTLKTGKPQLSIGALTGNMMHHAEDIALLENEGVNLLHLDVMDGRVWPKITVGPGFLAGLETKLIKDVHLLIEEPEKHIPDFVKAGADIITFCIEYTNDIGAALSLIYDDTRNILKGVSLNPDTSLDEIKGQLDQIDLVLLLAIGPDTGKETFFDEQASRVQQLREWKPELIIGIDGGIKKDNVGDVAKLSPDLIVTGSAVFDGNDVAQNISTMREAIEASTN